MTVQSSPDVLTTKSNSTIMKPSLHHILASLLIGLAALTSACSKKESTESTSFPAKAEVRHPLKGVITEIYADRGELMVKHEEIPGFMMAMTMMFKVDAVTLKAAKKDQAITGTLVQRGKEFWLENVKPAEGGKRNAL